MPYPNFHTARVREPKDFKPDSIRTIYGGEHVFPGAGLIDVPKNIVVITGQLLDQEYEGKKVERAVQSIRFPVEDFTEDQAKMWLTDERVKIIMFEKAEENTPDGDMDKLGSNWYNLIKENNTLTIDLFGDIGTENNSIDAFKNNVNAENSDNIELNISSLGGNVNDGLMIYEYLRAYKGQVSAKIIGMTASSATLIAMGADTIEMSENSLLLIHNVWTPMATGNADDLEKHARELRKIDDILANIYRKRTGKAKKTILKLMNEERWLDVDEAIKFGLVDTKIRPVKNEIEQKILNGITEKGLPKLPMVFLNKIKDKKMEMNKLTEMIENLTAKVENLFIDKKVDVLNKDEVLGIVNSEVEELKNLYDWQLNELNDTIKTLKGDKQDLIKRKSEEVTKLNTEVERLSGEPTITAQTDEVELQKVESAPSPFEGYAQKFKTQR